MKLLLLVASLEAVIVLLLAASMCATGSVDVVPVDDADHHEATAAQERFDQLMDEENLLNDIWEILNCTGIQQSHNYKMPIPNATTWSFLRGAYLATVGIQQASLPFAQIFGSGLADDDDDDDDAIIVKYHPQKGRAVYANRDFAQGDTVWQSPHSACFEEGSKYRHFLASVPPLLACDILEWAYAGKSYGVCVDLSEGSLVNHASLNESARPEYPRPENEMPNTDGIYALRKIAVGEEILIDYASFAEQDSWKLLGLGTWYDNENDDDDIETEEQKEEVKNKEEL